MSEIQTSDHLIESPFVDEGGICGSNGYKYISTNYSSSIPVKTDSSYAATQPTTNEVKPPLLGSLWRMLENKVGQIKREIGDVKEKVEKFASQYVPDDVRLTWNYFKNVPLEEQVADLIPDRAEQAVDHFVRSAKEYVAASPRVKEILKQVARVLPDSMEESLARYLTSQPSLSLPVRQARVVTAGPTELLPVVEPASRSAGSVAMVVPTKTSTSTKPNRKPLTPIETATLNQVKTSLHAECAVCHPEERTKERAEMIVPPSNIKIAQAGIPTREEKIVPVEGKLTDTSNASVSLDAPSQTLPLVLAPNNSESSNTSSPVLVSSLSANSPLEVAANPSSEMSPAPIPQKPGAILSASTFAQMSFEAQLPNINGVATAPEVVASLALSDTFEPHRINDGHQSPTNVAALSSPVFVDRACEVSGQEKPLLASVDGEKGAIQSLVRPAEEPMHALGLPSASQVARQIVIASQGLQDVKTGDARGLSIPLPPSMMRQAMVANGSSTLDNPDFERVVNAATHELYAVSGGHNEAGTDFDNGDDGQQSSAEKVKTVVAATELNLQDVEVPFGKNENFILHMPQQSADVVV